MTWSRSAIELGNQGIPATVLSQLGGAVETLPVKPHRPRTVALVACGRGEGTSTCTIKLALTLARRHARVLVIDANTHDPVLHVLSDVDQANGLADLMHGSVKLDAAIKPTSVPDVFLLTSGTPSALSNNGVLLPTALREQVMNHAAGYDFVLVDCPAVNVHQDAAALAAVCDGVILVVEGGRTLRQAAQTAKGLLQRANCNVLGVFMNRRKYYIPQYLYDRL